ncbi:hypothetical protein FRC07_001726 [Ceratobasidium sp. 392]|nr:hypothetical protein FRC07_001726 [Ceratobasidium sp. 392]
MIIPPSTSYTLIFVPFPNQSGLGQEEQEKCATAPPIEGQPIALQNRSVDKPQKWVIDSGPDPEQDAYRFYHVPTTPQDIPGEQGFSHTYDESGAPEPVILGPPSDYLLKISPFTVPSPDTPLLVTIHPKGFDSNTKYVTASDKGTLEIVNYEVGTEMKPSWLIIPNEPLLTG